MRVMDASKPVLNSPAQVGHAALLGVSLLFLAAILTMPHLDSLLNYAVMAFGGAIPLLVLGYITASYEFDPVPGALVARSIVAGGQLVAVAGYLAVAAGVILIVWHVDGTTAFVLGIVAVAGLIAMLVLGLIIALVEALRVSRKEKAEASDSGANI
jgi:hypothetical protein